MTNNLFSFLAWPTEYPFIITQPFGANPDNYRQFYYDDRGHQGVDFRAYAGTRIYCVAAGQVKMVCYEKLARVDGGHNFGIHCRVAHFGCYETIYCHLQSLTVEVGDLVSAGYTLGLADSTGNSRGSHLHLHLKDYGRVIDPTPFIIELEYMIRSSELLQPDFGGEGGIRTHDQA